jgi:hypothetical protein
MMLWIAARLTLRLPPPLGRARDRPRRRPDAHLPVRLRRPVRRDAAARPLPALATGQARGRLDCGGASACMLEARWHSSSEGPRWTCSPPRSARSATGRAGWRWSTARRGSARRRRVHADPGLREPLRHPRLLLAPRVGLEAQSPRRVRRLEPPGVVRPAQPQRGEVDPRRGGLVHHSPALQHHGTRRAGPRASARVTPAAPAPRCRRRRAAWCRPAAPGHR